MRQECASCVFAHVVCLLQRRVRRVLARLGHAAHEDVAMKLRALEAFDPALQTALRPLRNKIFVLRRGGQKIHVAEGVVAREQGVEAVEQVFSCPDIS